MKKLLLSFILVFLLSASAYAIPSYQEVRRSYVKSDSLLLDQHGDVLYELRTDKARRRLDWTLLKNISPALRMAPLIHRSIQT
jgi:penicillin-binding protein 1C